MPERPQPRPRPDNARFWSVIYNGYQDAPDKRKELQDAGAELAGYKGPMGPKIMEWVKAGLAKEVGTSLDKNKINAIDPPQSNKAFRGLFVALPLTDESVQGNDRRALLVVPREDGCDYVVIRPRYANQGTVESMKRDNLKNFREFNSRYWSPETPSLFEYPKITPGTGEPPFDIISKNQLALRFNITEKLNGEEIIAATVEKALKIAHANAQQKKKDKEIHAKVEAMRPIEVERIVFTLGDEELDTGFRQVEKDFDFGKNEFEKRIQDSGESGKEFPNAA